MWGLWRGLRRWPTKLLSGESVRGSGGPHQGAAAARCAQAHGAMGWRVGYIAYPDADGSDFLGLQLVKARAG